MTVTPTAIPGPPVTPGPSLLRTLPGSAYTDPEVLAAEQGAIFEQTWACVARSSDLDAPGAFQTVTVGGESVVVLRGRDRLVRAVFNVCRHRGARLCTDETGLLRRNLQCPYHAWTYDLTGRLVTAPNLSALADVDRDDLALRPVAVHEWLGYVWVCVAEDPPPFDDVEGEVVARLGDRALLDRYGVDQLAVGRRSTYDVAANWKLIVENFMECYHCATIHPELTEVLPEFADGLAAQYFVGHGAEFGPDVEGFTVDGTPGASRLPGLTDDEDRRYFAVTIKPQVFLSLVPDHVIVHRLTPMAPDRTRVTCDWLFAPDVAAAGSDLDDSVELFHRVNEQDFAACERTQPSMSSQAYRAGGLLVPSEHHLAGFHAWITERLRGGA